MVTGKVQDKEISLFRCHVKACAILCERQCFLDVNNLAFFECRKTIFDQSSLPTLVVFTPSHPQAQPAQSTDILFIYSYTVFAL